MSKSWLFKLIPGLLLILLAGTALAGGVVVSVDEAITDVTPGAAFDVNFTIRSAHDGSLQDGFHPIVMATDPATEEALRFEAVTRTEPGRYSVTLTLPTTGEWTWRIIPDADYPQELVAEMTPISVQAAAVVPAAASTPATLPVAAWVSLALMSAAALGLVLFGLRRRMIPAA